MATLTENAVRITSAASDIKSAIIAKGQTPTGGMDTYADAISAISGGGGTDVSDTTATAGDVLSGKVFHLSTGAKTTGTIESQEAQTITPTAVGTTTMVEAGKYVSGDQAVVIDASALGVEAAKIVEGETILGVYGTAEIGTTINLQTAPFYAASLSAGKTLSLSASNAIMIIVKDALSTSSAAAKYTYTFIVDVTHGKIVVIDGVNTTISVDDWDGSTDTRPGYKNGTITFYNNGSGSHFVSIYAIVSDTATASEWEVDQT